MAARPSQWVERRLIGSMRLSGQGLYVSVVTYPSGKKSVALSVGKDGETPRGMVMGPFLARTLRDLLDTAIRALGDVESRHDEASRKRYVDHVLEHGTHARAAGMPVPRR